MAKFERISQLLDLESRKWTFKGNLILRDCNLLPFLIIEARVRLDQACHKRSYYVTHSQWELGAKVKQHIVALPHKSKKGWGCGSPDWVLVCPGFSLGHCMKQAWWVVHTCYLLGFFGRQRQKNQKCKACLRLYPNHNKEKKKKIKRQGSGRFGQFLCFYSEWISV